MPRVDLSLVSKVIRSPRVAQLEGIFDVPEAAESRCELHFDAPIETRPWSVGLIVGPSGAGKTQTARALFSEQMILGYEWPNERSLIDGFPKSAGIREITAALSSVGFSSPPDWMKPFAVLSNGQQFRATMARALLESSRLIAIDEFTSVVDRQVALVSSYAMSKAVRRAGRQLVAVTCHSDVEAWLEPDWVIEPHLGRFEWRSQRRPKIEVEIRRVGSEAWSLFAPHHYMSADINRSAKCFGAYWGGRLVAFDAWLPFVGKLKDERKARRGHRTVVLPDYQGVGIGRALFDTVASAWSGLGYRAFSRTAHLAEIASRMRSGNWRLSGHGFTARDTGRMASLGASRTINRRAASFEWIGPRMDRELADALTE